MSKLYKYLTVCLLFLTGFSIASSAQQAQTEITLDEVYDKISEIISAADQALTQDCDPYGFQLSIKVSSKEGGVVSNVINQGAIIVMVEGMLANHKFDRFNLEKPLVPVNNNGFMYFSAGLTPQNAKNETYAVYSHTYTCKEFADGKLSTYTIQIGAQFIVQTPNDGAISGDVYYVNSDNKLSLLTDRAFKSSTNEKKIKYRRLGPGDDTSNSGELDKEDIGWLPFLQNQSNFQITSLTPGHYFPSVKINGCVQKFEDPAENEHEEAIIKTVGVFNWDNPSKGQKLVRPNSVKATKEEGVKIYTKFSTGNIVEGYILTPSESVEKWKDSAFVAKEDNQLLKGEQKVWIEPFGWGATSVFPRDTVAINGFYNFHNIPSGVYKVYLDGQKENGKIVEVCNCTEEKKPKEANMKYQQNLGTSGYEIHLDYSWSSGGDLFTIKAVWNNVIIAFGEGTEPQKYSAFATNNIDSAGRPLDIKGKILQPPFIIIERPEKDIICNDIFKSKGTPAQFDFTISGQTLSNFKGEPDFNEDGLYCDFEVLKFDTTTPKAGGMGVNATKGIYFSWAFVIELFSPDGDKGPALHAESTDIFDWLTSQGDTDVSKPFGGGFVDGRVPEDVIEKIKKNEEFYFTKNYKGSTYTIQGILPK